MAHTIDLAILKQVLSKHATLFFVLLLMSLIFCAFGFGFLYIADDLVGKIASIIFISVGVFILLLNIASNFNSIKLYYQHGLLKKYGLEVQATITNKNQEDYVPQADTDDVTPLTDADIERDLTIEYNYTYQGVNYNGTGLFSTQAIFDNLDIGEKIPVMILPQNPTISLPRMTKISNQVKHKSLLNMAIKNTTQVSSPMVDFEI